MTSIKPELHLASVNDASVSQMEMIDLLKRFVTLQDQFEQLTHYVEEAFKRIESLQSLINSKVLS